MPVLRGAGVLATCRPEGGQEDLHEIPAGAVAWKKDRIVWVGSEADLPAEYRDEETLDAGGRLVIPGLVDAHTHLAFGGWRAEEFVDRLRGRGYAEIAAAGGGIGSTVESTRRLATDELLKRARAFLRRMLALGVTTVEAKSGYCLDTEGELKILRVYRQLADEGPVRIVPTFLGAHALPPERRRDRPGYLRLVVEEMLPAVARDGLARFCDVFVEEGPGFDLGESRWVLEAARELGLGLKVHADQLSDGGGARLAAELGAVSADHLEHISEDGIAALAEAGTVAVSLPLATLYLGQLPLPARRLMEADVPVAVATDFNPGSAPSYHLPLAMLLACTLQGMTPAEALKGATVHAARAIGLQDRVGSLEPGKAADLAVIDAPDVAQWLYHFRPNDCVLTVAGGVPRWNRAEV